MNVAAPDERGFFAALIDDGRPLLKLTALSLALAGLFALFLTATQSFLPHDIEFLGMSPGDLCSINECRVVHFMVHDRVSFGGALLAIAALYFWLVEFPLKQGQVWAWWTLIVSGLIGFGSFLGYLGYGYLDTWHGAATLALLPCFVVGLVLIAPRLSKPISPRALFRPSVPLDWRTFFGLGRIVLLGTAIGLAAGGLVIGTVGITTVFVPQDLEYMGLSFSQLQAINVRLVPLIAHDRAGFGGGVCCAGVTMFLCIWCGQPTRSLWQALLVTGLAGFGLAIGIHPVIGYTDTFHLAPAVLGALAFAVGLTLTYPQIFREKWSTRDLPSAKS